MESKIVQFLPPDFVADCRFLMDNGRFAPVQRLARSEAHYARTLLSLEEEKDANTGVRYLTFPNPRKGLIRPKEDPYSPFDLYYKMGFAVWGYKYPNLKYNDRFTPGTITDIYAMLEKNGDFFEYYYASWDTEGNPNRITELPKDRLISCYKNFGPRTGRIVNPKEAIPILTRASGCTALESESGGT